MNCLPEELHRRLLYFVNGQALARLACTCRRYRQRILPSSREDDNGRKQAQTLWELHYAASWPDCDTEQDWLVWQLSTRFGRGSLSTLKANTAALDWFSVYARRFLADVAWRRGHGQIRRIPLPLLASSSRTPQAAVDRVTNAAGSNLRQLCTSVWGSIVYRECDHRIFAVLNAGAGQAWRVCELQPDRAIATVGRAVMSRQWVLVTGECQLGQHNQPVQQEERVWAWRLSNTSASTVPCWLWSSVVADKIELRGNWALCRGWMRIGQHTPQQQSAAIAATYGLPSGASGGYRFCLLNLASGDWQAQELWSASPDGCHLQHVGCSSPRSPKSPSATPYAEVYRARIRSAASAKQLEWELWRYSAKAARIIHAGTCTLPADWHDIRVYPTRVDADRVLLRDLALFGEPAKLLLHTVRTTCAQPNASLLWRQTLPNAVYDPTVIALPDTDCVLVRTGTTAISDQGHARIHVTLRLSDGNVIGSHAWPAPVDADDTLTRVLGSVCMLSHLHGSTFPAYDASQSAMLWAGHINNNATHEGQVSDQCTDRNALTGVQHAMQLVCADSGRCLSDNNQAAASNSTVSVESKRPQPLRCASAPPTTWDSHKRGLHQMHGSVQPVLQMFAVLKQNNMLAAH
ncbi:hypothetical protein THASP1DRAFT_22476 [Thamnocephalis sphaerospora]|uniref:F-box domain-containing protein n=1 Tax=Thamnocephalis sphaerospora TaxID=78915 RepID=A0A4P9XU31_9FUNG|nr:hypothetical protein THASP1DRAFT_22476 [Thamnocephalis sphaerospora]|eukprot:RKP09724.1 hypothetical protein THASP1DRAFT_22476 [Thamnocephalis sphaerospora]